MADHWLDAPAPEAPEPGSENPAIANLFGKGAGIPDSWAKPPGKTPGQIYAAYGDTGAISGETEGLSPAMRAMIRRNLGRRLSEQTMAERQQTAEQAMRGAAGVGGFVNPALGATAAGLTSRFMGDTPTETAAQVASGLLPWAGGRLVQAAPRVAAATYGTGATMLAGGSTQSEAADSAASIRAQRRLEEQRQDAERENRKAAQKARDQAINDFVAWKSDPTNKKTLESFSPEWQAQIKGAADMKTAQTLFLQAAEEKRQAEDFKNWKTENALAIGHLAEGYQNRIAGAKNLEEGRAIFEEGAKARKEAGMTLAERYPGPMTALEVALPFASAAIPGYNRLRQINAMDRAAANAEGQFARNFGREAGELTQGGLNEADAAAQAVRAQQKEMGGMLGTGLHPGELAGGMIAPYLAGTLAPGIVDFTLGHMSSDPGGADRAAKALENATSPGRILFNVGEGGAGSIAGNWAANQLRGSGNVLARAAAAAGNIERAPRNVSPGSVLTQATSPLPATPPPNALPGSNPGLWSSPSSPTRVPPAMWLRPEEAPSVPPAPAPPPPYQPLASIPQPIERPPGYIPGLAGASLRSHLMRLQREHPASFVYPTFENR